MAHLLPNGAGRVKASRTPKKAYTDLMKIVAIIALLLVPTLGAAQDVAPRNPDQWRPLAGVEYYCTDSTGGRVELGQVICISASCTTWLARCEMSLNNPMWRKIQDGCPAARVIDRLRTASQG